MELSEDEVLKLSKQARADKSAWQWLYDYIKTISTMYKS